MTDIYNKNMDNKTAAATLKVSLTHLSFLKKAAGVPRGHRWVYAILKDFITKFPEALASSSVAQRMAQGQGLVISNRIGHSAKHRPNRNPKVKVGTRPTTPNRVSCTYRFTEDTYNKLQLASDRTKLSVSYIHEQLVAKYLDEFVKENEVRDLTNAKIAAEAAKKAYEAAQERLKAIEQGIASTQEEEPVTVSKTLPVKLSDLTGTLLKQAWAENNSEKRN